MANLISVRLNRGDSHSWGFRLQGGKDFGTPLVIQKISGGSPAERAGLIAGDTVVRINNVDVYNLRHKDAQDVILRAGPSFDIAVHRGGSTWKPAVTPVGSVPSPRPVAPLSNVSPVTATSLQAGRPQSIDAIGTTHNVSAKPFSVGQVNGGPRLVNKQYNSPLPLYSEQSIAETLSAQTEVLSNGVLGVNFKKNEKSYDSANSAVFRMVQEADKEPRDYEAEQDTPGSGVITAPLGIAGLRHVTAPENKPQPPTPQLPPGQNICADCERLIVGVFVRIKDKNLHVECFKCSTCGTSLKNVGYYNLNNKLYCDVHAKLAARNNPPAPNLQPVTVPPGGRIPAGTITAALSSHPLSSPAPLSPNINYSAAPYQPGGASFSSPRPFSSVNAPLSPPSSTYPKLSPSSPTTTPLAGRYSSVKPGAPLRESRSVQNIVWPPIQNEPELPTASPLYFPPPSQVQPFAKQPDFEQIEDQEYSELEEMSYITQESGRNMSLCSTEVSSITGRRSAVECSETISDTIDTQILVDSIMQKRIKPPEERPKSPPPADVNVTFTISEAQLKQGAYVNTLASSSVCETSQATDAKSCSLKETKQLQCLASSSSVCETSQATEAKSCSLKETKQSQCLASMYEQKIKVENTVPHKWESPMVVALTVASDKPYSELHSETSGSEHLEITESDTFSQIPTKTSTSALASALSTAPSEPFTPVTSASLEPIPLPEETVPYFPPEHPIVTEPKPSKETHPNEPLGEVPKQKKTKAEDELFKDLPKQPPEPISMLSALTTAPDRPYSPLTVDTVSYQSEALEDTKVATANASLIQTNQKSKVMLSEASKSQSFLKDVTQMSTKNIQKPYSSFSNKTTSYDKETKIDQSKSVKASTSSELVKKKQDSKQMLDVYSSDKLSTSGSLSKNIQSTENITKLSSGMPPRIQMIRGSFETKTDKVQMEMSYDFAGTPVMQQQIIKKSSSTTDVEEQSHQKSVSEKMAISQSSRKEIEAARSESKSQDIRATAAAKTVMVSSTPALYEASTDNISESALLRKATSIQAKDTMTTREVVEESREAALSYKETNVDRRYSNIQQSTLQIPPKERVTVIQPGQVNLNVPKISFQPVSEDLPPSTTFSPRPRPITPSMINKPAPVIPSYQASLVAVQCAATETNIFDPTSPATSRSPSPHRSGRAVSPAPGPPPNPLQSHKSAEQIMYEQKMQHARSQVQSYIPQHQSKAKFSNLANYQAQKASDISRQSVSSSCQQQNMDVSSVSQYSKQQQLHKMANLQSERVETCRDSSIEFQRKKTIREEYERTQKSKAVQFEKYSSGVQFHSSEATNAAVVENQAVVGFHLTNPQPLKSPFISSDEGSTNKPLTTTCTQSNISQNVPETGCNKKAVPSSALPKLIKSPPLSSGSAPTTTVSSNVNVKRPNISQPNTGSGGGRQAGAIGVAPKRGRGILNLSAGPGSRVPLCAQCHSNIRGPFITALGKIWCPDHFICATPSCRRALHDLGFVEEHGQLYCEYCFEQYLAPPCSKCSAKVKGDCLKAIGKNFHPECFNCVYCGKLFGNSPFFLEDGQPYCEADWNELFTTKCFACGFPVEAGDRWVEALNNNYHSQCFNCTMCKKNLEGQSFFAKGGRPFCKNHAR